uniref:Vesicle transport protein n=1 Tax=Eucampia antarctica TaxID=49252 RepID=A0A7S2VZL1_9STRA|mmetsp:Transcript_14302/g.13817  ORF Transcript_14302/g.13817 Transcript_14302/m.13817 type:complete len:167 (+) Transcript_14302:2-502(+)
MIRTRNKKVGVMLLGSGGVFTMVGMSLFFNKSLMRIGNLLFIAGIPMTIGPGRTAGYFLQPKKARATGCLMLGIFLVMVGWPVFGIALEIFGLLNLFGNLFPVLMVVLKQMPIVGNLLNSNKNSGGKKSRTPKNTQYDNNNQGQDHYSRGDDDRYHDDRGDASRYY